MLPGKNWGTRWPGGLCLGLRIQRSGVRAPLRSNRVVSLSKAHLLPKSTGNTLAAMAPSQHDLKINYRDVKNQINQPEKNKLID